MNLGVKIGPLNWKEALEKTQAKYCEVWYRLDWHERFEEMFSYLRDQEIAFGLHFWAVLSGGYEPNLAFDRDFIADETQTLIKETVDHAQEVGASYVNIHPGAQTLKKLDFQNQSLTVMREKMVDEQTAIRSLLMRTKELADYAKEKNLLFLVETVPANEGDHWRDETGRIQVQIANNISPDILVELGRQGIFLTNDIGHTAASWIGVKNYVWKKLFDMTENLLPYTKLIHLNTIAPPLNGTDSHHGVLEKDFQQGVFPDSEQLRSLLALFKDRDDVWLIPESSIPEMATNYFAMQNLL